MSWLKFRAILFAFKRIIIPIILGSLVMWLIAHGFSNWADVICTLSDAIAVNVEECK
jgi:hypothetical protein